MAPPTALRLSLRLGLHSPRVITPGPGEPTQSATHTLHTDRPAGAG